MNGSNRNRLNQAFKYVFFPQKLSSKTISASHQQKGLTLTEFCVVLTLMLIMAWIGYPSFVRSIDRHRMENFSRAWTLNFQSSMLQARTRDETLHIYWVKDPTESCFLTTSKSSMPNCTCAQLSHLNQTCVAPQDTMQLMTTKGMPWTLEARPAHMALSPDGTVTPSGSLTLRNEWGDAHHHIINILGRIRSCRSYLNADSCLE